MPIVPFKLNQERRHHIPRQKRKVTNWPAYDASLRQRGSLTVWFTEEAGDAWAAEPRTTRGGQPWYSALAILTALTLRAVFRLAFRQTEGLIGSIIGLLGLTLRVSDHTTLSRRAATVDVPQPRRPSPEAGGDAEPVHLPRSLGFSSAISISLTAVQNGKNVTCHKYLRLKPLPHESIRILLIKNLLPSCAYRR